MGPAPAGSVKLQSRLTQSNSDVGVARISLTFREEHTEACAGGLDEWTRMMSSPMVNTDARAAPPASAKATAMTIDPAPIFDLRIYPKHPTTLSWQPGEPARGRILHG